MYFNFFCYKVLANTTLDRLRAQINKQGLSVVCGTSFKVIAQF